METLVSPPKRRKKSTEKRICFICKKVSKISDSYKNYIFNPTLVSIGNLLDKLKKRLQYFELHRETQNAFDDGEDIM